jgi:hypothetical protein
LCGTTGMISYVSSDVHINIDISMHLFKYEYNLDMI